MPNIYQHIGKNKRDTFIIVVLFIAVISFIGWFMGEIYIGGEGYFFVGWALVLSGLSSFITYYNSDKIVLAISGATEVKYEDDPYLHKLVENMTIASGIPTPRIYKIEDTAMNAFATGRDPEHSVICFTTGIVDGLEKRELEGVIAHEMSHIGNYDIRLMSIVSVLVGSIQLLADFFTRGRFYKMGGGRRSGSSRSGGRVGMIIMVLGILMLIISPIIATLIKMAISRKREYLADSTAALITRYPQGLANALRKLSKDREILEAANGATAHLYIVAPIKDSFGFTIMTAFSTHPPIEDRIARLESM
ncbi:M48 family metallopeptidase [Patescibacteria group bacterium]|nr:M48 family metallopeptidase [Patescibacteria group bacterium]